MQLVNSASFMVREALMARDAATAEHLAKATGLDPVTVSKVIQNNLKRGWIQRTGEVDTEGRRADGQLRKLSYVELTPAGRDQQLLSREKVSLPTRDALRQRKRNEQPPKPKPEPKVEVLGEFTALIREHNWPPGFVSRIAPGPALQALSKAIVSRETSCQTGRGWGAGTQFMNNTPHQQARPQFMGKMPQGVV